MVRSPQVLAQVLGEALTSVIFSWAMDTVTDTAVEMVEAVAEMVVAAEMVGAAEETHE